MRVLSIVAASLAYLSGCQNANSAETINDVVESQIEVSDQTVVEDSYVEVSQRSFWEKLKADLTPEPYDSSSYCGKWICHLARFQNKHTNGS